MKHPKNTLKLNEIRNESKKLFGDEYTIKSRYFKNGKQFLIVSHNNCKRIKNCLASQYLKFHKPQIGHCQFCNGGRPKSSISEIEKRFYELNDRKYFKLLEEVEPYLYPSNKYLKQRQFKVLCKICKTITIKQTNNLNSRSCGCKTCYIKRRTHVRIKN